MHGSIWEFEGGETGALTNTCDSENVFNQKTNYGSMLKLIPYVIRHMILDILLYRYALYIVLYWCHVHVVAALEMIC